MHARRPPTSTNVLFFLALALLIPHDAFPVRAAPPVPKPAKAVANDDCADALPIGFGTFVGDTSDATVDGEARCAFEPSPDVWFRFSSPAAVDVAVDTRDSALDTTLSVHSGCPGSPANTIVCNQDNFDYQSAVGFRAAAGEEYFIRVAGCCADEIGGFNLNVQESGSVAGTVTDAVSGQPLAGITVAVVVPSIQEIGGYAGVGGAGTGPAGEYVVGDLPPGT